MSNYILFSHKVSSVRTLNSRITFKVCIDPLWIFFLSNFNLIPLIWPHCIFYISILFLLSLESVFGILPSSIIENGTADLFFLTVNTNLSSYTGIILPIDAPHAIAWGAPMILP